MTPRDLIDHVMRHQIDDNRTFDHLADDVVVETPFAPGGRKRIEGKAAFLAVAEAGRATLPVRFDEVANLVVHETTDPEVVIAEYTIAGTLLETGARAAADFITVARVREGLVVHWREYQDGLAMAAAFGPAYG
jgi:uncharacterized protein